jgi:hypothetical protein
MMLPKILFESSAIGRAFLTTAAMTLNCPCLEAPRLSVPDSLPRSAGQLNSESWRPQQQRQFN